MEINAESIAYTKKTLENYFFLKREEAKNRKEAFILGMEIEDECKINGMSYGGINGNGCSASYPKDSYINQLIKEQAGYDAEADACERKYKSLDKENRINERLSKISNDQQKLIIFAFDKNVNYKYIAKELYEGTSKQAVYQRINNAVIAFMER